MDYVCRVLWRNAIFGIEVFTHEFPADDNNGRPSIFALPWDEEIAVFSAMEKTPSSMETRAVGRVYKLISRRDHPFQMISSENVRLQYPTTTHLDDVDAHPSAITDRSSDHPHGLASVFDHVGFIDHTITDQDRQEAFSFGATREGHHDLKGHVRALRETDTLRHGAGMRSRISPAARRRPNTRATYSRAWSWSFVDV